MRHSEEQTEVPGALLGKDTTPDLPANTEMSLLERAQPKGRRTQCMCMQQRTLL